MTDKKRKSFVLHIDSLDILDDLDDQQVANLFRTIKAYQNDEPIEIDSLTKMIFLPFKNQFNRDNEKYKTTCERRAAAGSKGGKAKVANASNSKQELASVANLAESDNKSKNKSDSNNKSKSESNSKRFVPPTLEQVQGYCLERENFINPQSFLNHYESNGWMRGKNKIKDWKACVRTWENNSNSKQSSHNLQNKVYESGDL